MVAKEVTSLDLNIFFVLTSLLALWVCAFDDAA